MKTVPALLLLFVPLAAPAWGQETQVTASVDADTVGVDDNLQLTLTVTGRDSGDAEAPRLTRLRGFRVAAGPSVSTQFQWINGRSSSSRSFTYTLIPEREGSVTLEPIELTIGGKSYRTAPLQIRVVAGGGRVPPPRARPFDRFGDADPTRPRQPRAADEVFVAAEVDRGSVHPGEQVTLSYHLYTQVAVTGIQLQENPSLNGFWVEDLQVDASPSGRRRVVNGKEYLDYVVKKQALFPNAPGTARIPPSTFAVSVKAAGDFFGLFGQPETVYRKTKEVELEVQPLPEQGKPPQFGNAVGSFNLTSSLGKTEAATGDAVSLRVKLSGRGNLKMIGDVALPPMPDFSIFSSKRADNVRPFEGDQIGGDKTWEYVIVPKAPGDQTIPGLTFAYFDPKLGRYETLTTPDLRLRVTRGAETAGALTSLAGVGKQTVTRQGSDIHFIKLSSDLEPAGGAFSPGLVVAILAALSFSVGAFLYERERSREHADLPLGRRRRARRAALVRLGRAEKGARGDARRFYDEAAAALSGYLADRFGLPEIALTGDTLERTLAAGGVEPATIEAIAGVAAECDFGRFVAASAQPEKMRGIADRIRSIIDRLERL